MTSTQYGFFLLPEEAMSLLREFVTGREVSLYLQLNAPGAILAPMKDVAELLRAIEGTVRLGDLYITSQDLPPGPTDGTFDGLRAVGSSIVSLPHWSDETLHLGRVAGVFVPDQEDDARVLRALVRTFRKAAPRNSRLMARSLRNGAQGPVRGIGCSPEVVRRYEAGQLRLKQWGVQNVEFILVRPEQTGVE
jgi:hypothetical protein